MQCILTTINLTFKFQLMVYEKLSWRNCKCPVDLWEPGQIVLLKFHPSKNPGYDLLDVRCYHQGLSQHAKSPGEDAAWWHGKGTPHTPMWNAAIVGRRFKKVQKLNLTGGCGCGHPQKTWPEGLSSAGLTVTHPSNKKSSSGRLRSTVKLVPPLHWGLMN